VRVRAFAKINLLLRVLGTRPDGYHALRTIFQSIDLHDTLTFRRRRGPLRVTCDDPRLPVDGSNLIVRAAERVWRASGKRGTPRDVEVHLAKRIPIEAGLGGGSSDAAAALKAFGRLWRVDAQRLRDLAPAIGADVPFFFDGGTAMGAERGDRIFPLSDFPDAHVVLAIPPFGVSTRDAFGWFDADRRRAGGRTGRLMNDLQGPVARRHRRIGRLASALRRLGAAHAAMTGSGSAVFGLFEAKTAAIRAARELEVSESIGVIVTRTVSRAVYRRQGAFLPATGAPRTRRQRPGLAAK
jgi:4-diphosphocytidyl-2-C-methyl-D-erythritol kinase